MAHVNIKLKAIVLHLCVMKGVVAREHTMQHDRFLSATAENGPGEVMRGLEPSQNQQ